MENNNSMKVKDLHFIAKDAFIDEIRFNSKIMFVYPENPEVVGVVVVQGDERRGFEFLMLNNKEDAGIFADELIENGFRPKFYAIPDDKSMVLHTDFFIDIDDVNPPVYQIDVDQERKVLQVECFFAELTPELSIPGYKGPKPSQSRDYEIEF